MRAILSSSAHSLSRRKDTLLHIGVGRTSSKERKRVTSESLSLLVVAGNPACDEAFQSIVFKLPHAPVLAFADQVKHYILHVDASLNRLGTALNQEHPEELHPVAFASRKLNQAERNHPVHQLEFLALKWALVDKFHDCLYGANFTGRTDNNPLTYVLTTARLNATGHRWLAALSTYDFSICYKPGCENIDADLLSSSLQETDDEWVDVPPSGIKALCRRISTGGSYQHTTRFVDQLGVSPDAIQLYMLVSLRLK